MDCTTCRDRLLEAELPDLRGEGDRDVAAHLAACVACRRLAGEIVSAEAGLAHAPAAPRSPWPALAAGLAFVAAAAVVAALLLAP